MFPIQDLGDEDFLRRIGDVVYVVYERWSLDSIYVMFMLAKGGGGGARRQLHFFHGETYQGYKNRLKLLLFILFKTYLNSCPPTVIYKFD